MLLTCSKYAGACLLQMEYNMQSRLTVDVTPLGVLRTYKYTLMISAKIAHEATDLESHQQI